MRARRGEGPLLVTGYVDPDLDGTACAIAYAEWLTSTGVEAVAGVFGEPQPEARWVLQRFGLPSPPRGDEVLGRARGVVLVDASDRRGIDPRIDPRSVVELIDHRSEHEAHAFPLARVEIEAVGAAATLVARRFRNAGRSPTAGSAAALSCAVVSNTVDFRASVTTELDRRLAAWLTEIGGVTRRDHVDMLRHKGRIDRPLVELLKPVTAGFLMGRWRLGVVQWEGTEIERLVGERLAELREALELLAREQSLHPIVLTCIDVLQGGNWFICFHAEGRELLTRALEVEFTGPVARRQGVLMRKELVPALRAIIG